MQFSDQVVIVTGGGRGIGQAIALSFARSSANVVICSRTQEELDGTARKLKEIGADVLTCVTDVSDPAAVSRLVERTRDRFGHIDVLVNNAGVWLPGDAAEYEVSALDTTMDINVKGVFLCSQAVFEPMREQGSGNIVNISSVRGKEGYPGMAAYSASKFAVNGLTEALAREWEPHDIRVNAVCPGPVDTGESRDKSRIRPENVADITLFLASKQSDHVTGETVVVSKQDFAYERYD